MQTGPAPGASRPARSRGATYSAAAIEARRAIWEAALLVGSVLPRKVHYLATTALFRNPLIARFPRRVGGDPRLPEGGRPAKMDRNEEMFAACDQAFDRGRLVGIYPEGATHAEAHVQRIKTGAARISLGYGAQAPRRLTVMPVGLLTI